jgi:hypothetical protein
MLDQFVPQETTEYILAMGSLGPFGQTFADKVETAAKVIWASYPILNYAQLKTPPNTFPIQTDGYNCGVVVVLNIMDLILSQWNHSWIIDDLVSDNEFGKTFWYDQILRNNAIVLQSMYEVPWYTSFVSNTMKSQDKIYKRIFNYVRLEFILLMERVHCIYVKAFSMRNCWTKWWSFGKPRMNYAKAAHHDPYLKYIHQIFFYE